MMTMPTFYHEQRDNNGFDVKTLITAKLMAKITKDTKIEDLPVDKLMMLGAVQSGNFDLRSILGGKLISDMIDGKDIDLEKALLISAIGGNGNGELGGLGGLLALKMLGTSDKTDKTEKNTSAE